MKIRTILFLASTFLFACGSEQSADNTPDLPPGVEPVPPGQNPPGGGNDKKPGVTNPADPVDPTDGGTTDPGDGGTTDPTDGGSTDPTDGGSTDPTDGGTTDPTDPTDPGDGGTTDPGDGGGPTDPPVDGGGPTDPPQPATCTSFTYSAWSECVSGTQTRTVTSSSPADCVGGNPELSQSCVVPPPTSVTVGCVQVSLASSEGNTFCYQVSEIENCKDLSHWEIATNCSVLSGTPEAGLVIGTDPKSGVKGAKWNVDSSFSSGLFCVTVDGQSSTGATQVASKSGIPISYGTIAGPVCQ